MTKNPKFNKSREMVGRGLLKSFISISADLCTDSALNKVKIGDKLLTLARYSFVSGRNAFILEYITGGTLPKLPPEYQPILFFDDF
jgi:hypothetical protein